jgi:hypothetical protein
MVYSEDLSNMKPLEMENVLEDLNICMMIMIRNGDKFD